MFAHYFKGSQACTSNTPQCTEILLKSRGLKPCGITGVSLQ